jgi:cobalt-zinc-cadmium efflux system outer membrane protein
MIFLALLSGCQNPMATPAMKGLEAEYQELAAARTNLDRSGDWALKPQKSDSLQLVSAEQPGDKQPLEKKPKVILTIPKELPGADDPGFKVPKGKAELEKYIKDKYPPLPPLEGDVPLAPGPEGRPMSLADLQRLATQYSPAIRSAEAGVAAARGAVRQSLAYPNPTFSMEHDTVQTGPAGYPGFSIEQVIKTSNKLELQGAASTMDLFNAQLALRRARSDVAYQVRGNYFAILVAQENVRMSRAFARFTDEIYTVQVSLLKGNEAAAYEPMQLRPLALQARFNVIQAINQYHASWRQLVVSLGLPDMPPAEVAGRVDLPVPEFDYEKSKDRIVSRHTDVLTAQNNIHKADYLLRLAKVQPIPDVDVRLLVQKDYSSNPSFLAHSLQVGVPLPVWDRNKGNILQAESNLIQAKHNLPVTQNALINNLADAYNRYVTNKKQVDIALEQTKDQVRVYKAIYNRFRGGDLAVNFSDVVTAQQTLAGYLTTYFSALSLQWQAVVDVANLLQIDDLFQGSEGNADASPLEQLEAMIRFPRQTPRGTFGTPSAVSSER